MKSFVAQILRNSNIKDVRVSAAQKKSNGSGGLYIQQLCVWKLKMTCLDVYRLKRILQSLDLGRDDIWQTLFFCIGTWEFPFSSLLFFKNFLLFLEDQQEIVFFVWKDFNGGSHYLTINCLVLVLIDNWNLEFPLLFGTHRHRPDLIVLPSQSLLFWFCVYNSYTLLFLDNVIK